MYVELTNEWAYLYFYGFYFCSVLITMNVLTAFIFDAFIMQFTLKVEEIDRENNRKVKTRKKIDRLKLKRLQKKNKQKKSKKKGKKKINDNTIPDMNTSMIQKTESLDEFNIYSDMIDEINSSPNEAWHKWVTIAMVYEFKMEDVAKGVWLYDKRLTTADFYEKIYGDSTTKTFMDYLMEWKEIDPDEYDDSTRKDSNISYISTFNENNDYNLSTKHSYGSLPNNDNKIILTQHNLRLSVIDHNDLKLFETETTKDYGDINEIKISGIKTNSMFDALSIKPQVGYKPTISIQTKLTDLNDIN